MTTGIALNALTRRGIGLATAITMAAAILATAINSSAATQLQQLQSQFDSPPPSARPWVYWYFMDGHMQRAGITADLQSMKKAGIGGAIFLEVNVGIPRGPVPFMSPLWQKLFVHAAHEADRLGLQMAVGTGPGWCGAGGPWIPANLSMQDLVDTSTPVTGPQDFTGVLPQAPPPPPRSPLNSFPPKLKKEWAGFYRDVAVIAFPTPAIKVPLKDVTEAALYYERAYSSQKGATPFIAAPATMPTVAPGACVDSKHVIDLTGKMDPDGHLHWHVPAGNWTIMRLGRTSTGQLTRPSPAAGLGFETDKFNPVAINLHLKSYVQPLLDQIGKPAQPDAGLTMLHFDSWEMRSQNWSANFRKQFIALRGYDPLPYLPAMSGRIVDSAQISTRFLWDLRQTAQELVLKNQIDQIKQFGRQHGMGFEIEPYDEDPCADLYLGSTADIPMCEFWSKGYGFNTDYTVIEATSIAHVEGRPIVGAESFTAGRSEAWHQYPGSMKAQGDWALCQGVNRFAFHRFQAQSEPTRKPGMTMGPYGVHWDRTQTWWDMVPAYHLYISRCSQLLRQGTRVADILYLTSEGAPHVFRAPPSALTGKVMGDRRGYNFDGCDPHVLIAKASVKDGRVVFPGGASYRVLVLPEVATMTPKLLAKIDQLLHDGATVVGPALLKSPSLQNYPQCDQQVHKEAEEIWGNAAPGDTRTVGKGRLIAEALPAVPAGVEATPGKPKTASFDLYPNYESTATLLASLDVPPDFTADAPIRYIHRHDGDIDLYFISNKQTMAVDATCQFRVTGRQPRWWSPVTGQNRTLEYFKRSKDGTTAITMHLQPLQSGFVIFAGPAISESSPGQNFPRYKPAQTIDGPWNVSFDPKWGGPAHVVFPQLTDWSKSTVPGIKYYSGHADYEKTFDVGGESPTAPMMLSLGEVRAMASVQLNGKDLGVIWCDPWRVAIPPGLLKPKNNDLRIIVANLWINRLIGDAGLPKDKRYTWAAVSPYRANSPLVVSGLLGPVQIEVSKQPSHP